MNQEQIQGKWKEIKGGVRNLWGQITDDELEATKGNIASISGIVHRKYGESKEVIKEKMDTLLDSFDNATDRMKVEAQSSFERNPIQERTSSKSQNQDKETELRSDTEEGKDFVEDSFDASQDSIDHSKGSTNNSYMNPNREKVGRELNH